MGVMMDDYNVESKVGFFEGDIEKGGLTVGGDSDNGGLGRSNKQEEEENLCIGMSGDSDSKGVRLIVVENKVLEERNGVDVENKVVKKKPKAMSAKKPPKPPRPPRGLSLDSADQKLIRELHELARLKRARVERMKALKKAKETRATSSKNQLFATLLTILFCLVLLLQGLSSRTGINIRGPPFSSEVAAQHNIISIRHHPLPSTTSLSRPGSESPRLVEQDTKKPASRATG